MRILLLLGALVLLSFGAIAQPDLDGEIRQIEDQLEVLATSHQKLESDLEALKLARVHKDILAMGIPAIADSEEVIHHKAMSLCYSEAHEQAKWVVHIVTPEIINGNVSRTNDFRVDPQVKSGTAVKKDYWDSGYDRGHLAPSADFRWSQTALSESYFYSNMSPQRPELNRQSWAKLENTVRDYVVEYKEQVMVVTGGVLTDDLEKLGENEVSIPTMYYKVLLDYEGDDKKGIAFLMPNTLSQYPLFSYAVSIDSVEALTGIDFFPALSPEEQRTIEATMDIKAWQTADKQAEVLPLNPTELSKGKFNTVQAKYHTGSKATVCGTVVSTKLTSKASATFINLDKKFPDQIFTVTIWDDARRNFSYEPHIYLVDKQVCFTGYIKDNKGTPTMSIVNEKEVEILEQ